MLNIKNWCHDIRCHVLEYSVHKRKAISIGNWFKAHNLAYKSFNDWEVGKSEPRTMTYETINKIIAEEKGEIERARNV